MSKLLDKLQFQTIENRKKIDKVLRLLDYRRSLARKQAANLLGEVHEVEVSEFLKDGHLNLLSDSELLPNDLSTVVEYCKKTLSTVGLENNKSKKEYLKAILKDFDFEDHLPILELAFNKNIIKVVAKYLNDFPVLANLALFYSPPSSNQLLENFSGSQLFHMDEEDITLCKFWLLINDVSESDGPTVILNKKVSSRIAKSIKYKKGQKIKSDQKLIELIEDESLMPITGKSGDVHLLDTAGVFHYGSRVSNNSKGRYMLMFSYSTSFNLDHGLFGRKSRLKNLDTSEIITQLNPKQTKMLLDSSVY